MAAAIPDRTGWEYIPVEPALTAESPIRTPIPSGAVAIPDVVWLYLDEAVQKLE
jgi:hypothetical protein